MLLEDLLSLPIGTRVFGEIAVPTTVSGVVASRGDGPHFILGTMGILRFLSAMCRNTTNTSRLIQSCDQLAAWVLNAKHNSMTGRGGACP